jgi:pimeloyl-ACP methyl ester carboxylesterase
LIVPENWRKPKGRQLKLNLIIVPARAHPAREPIFFLIGGPGQAATDAAAGFVDSWERGDHDVVLLDFRGTSKELRLDCMLGGSDENPQEYLEPLFFEGTRYRSCAVALAKKADLTQFTTPNAIQDLDALRIAMGYDQIDLEGTSYGIWEAIAYLHAFSAHVRAAILSGLVPLSNRAPLYLPAAAQRAFDTLVSECQSDGACATAYPQLHEDLATILRRLEERPAKVRVEHPVSGKPIELSLKASAFVDGLRVMLYSVENGRHIPRLLQAALAGDYQPFAQAALHYSRDFKNGIRTGLLLSVTCPEDVARIRSEEVASAVAGTFIGGYRVRGQMAACAVWPRAKIPEDYFASFRSNVPTLLISGNLDPVTPPQWGVETRKTLPNSLHVIVPGAHVSSNACLDGLGRRMFETGRLKDLDASCVAEIHNPSFVLPDT